MKTNEYIAPQISLFNAKVNDERLIEQNEAVTEKVFNYINSALVEKEIIAELEEVKFYFNVTQYVYKLVSFDGFTFDLEDTLQKIANEAREINGDSCVSGFVDINTKGKCLLFTVWHFNRRRLQFYKLAQKGEFDGVVSLYCTPEGEPHYEQIDSFYLTTISSLGNQADYLLKSILANLVYNYSPELLKLIVFDGKEDFNEFNGIPHAIFKETIHDFNLFYPVIDWLEAEVDKRRKLFEESKISNLTAYNKKNEQKLPYIVLAVNSFMAVFKEYGVYSAKLIKRLTELLDKAQGTSITFLFSAQTVMHDPYDPSIRARATNAICFAMNTATDAYNAIGHALRIGDMLTDKDGVMVKQGTKLIEMLPCFITPKELNSLVSYLKTQPGEVYEEAYKAICVNAESGSMGRRTRILGEDEFICKEYLRYLILHGKSGEIVQNMNAFLRVDSSIGDPILERLVQKGYISKHEKNIFTRTVVRYKPLITAEQFKEIFGEEI